MAIYNSCKECEHYNKTSCPFAEFPQETKNRACLFLPLRIKPIHDFDIDRKAEELTNKIIQQVNDAQKMPSAYLPSWLFETQYSYADFVRIAFASDTPEKQARDMQDALIAAKAVAKFRRRSIKKVLFFINGNGEIRVERP